MAHEEAFFSTPEDDPERMVRAKGPDSDVPRAFSGDVAEPQAADDDVARAAVSPATEAAQTAREAPPTASSPATSHKSPTTSEAASASEEAPAPVALDIAALTLRLRTFAATRQSPVVVSTELPIELKAPPVPAASPRPATPAPPQEVAPFPTVPAPVQAAKEVKDSPAAAVPAVGAPAQVAPATPVPDRRPEQVREPAPAQPTLVQAPTREQVAAPPPTEKRLAQADQGPHPRVLLPMSISGDTPSGVRPPAEQPGARQPYVTPGAAGAAPRPQLSGSMRRYTDPGAEAQPGTAAGPARRPASSFGYETLAHRAAPTPPVPVPTRAPAPPQQPRVTAEPHIPEPAQEPEPIHRSAEQTIPQPFTPLLMLQPPRVAGARDTVDVPTGGILRRGTEAHPLPRTTLGGPYVRRFVAGLEPILATDPGAIRHTRDARGNIVITVNAPFPAELPASDITLLLDTADKGIAKAAEAALTSRFRTSLENSPYNDQVAGQLAHDLHVTHLQPVDSQQSTFAAPRVRLLRDAPSRQGNHRIQSSGLLDRLGTPQGAGSRYYMSVGRVRAELAGLDAGLACRIQDPRGYGVNIVPPTLEIIWGRLEASVAAHRHTRARINEEVDGYAAVMGGMGLQDVVADAETSAAKLLATVRQAYSLRPGAVLGEFLNVKSGLNPNEQIAQFASHVAGGSMRLGMRFFANIGWPLEAVGITNSPARRAALQADNEPTA